MTTTTDDNPPESVSLAAAAAPATTSPTPSSTSLPVVTTTATPTPPSPPPNPTATALLSANAGFAHLFSNHIDLARAAFAADPASPFHLLGLGVCAFLEAALGMESGLMGEASRLLAASEAGAKRAGGEARKTVVGGSSASNNNNGRGDGGGRFAPGLEYEILQADAVVLLGLTHALSESYMGYFQCMYALNAAHSKFTKLYKTVFPAGLDAYRTPAPSRKPSSSNLVGVGASSNLVVGGGANGNENEIGGEMLNIPSANASTASVSSTEPPTPTSPSVQQQQPAPTPKPAPPPAPTKSLFGRWSASTASLLSSKSSLSAAASKNNSTASLVKSAEDLEREKEKERTERERGPEGPVEEMIVAGVAFGFGLFNLVFSLLPKRVQSLVGLLGFKHDRALALRALAVSAGLNILDDDSDEGTLREGSAGRDVHGVFAGLVLMTFHGVVLLLSGYQADEARIIRRYKAIVDGIESRYPTGSLWILNRAKILRMSHDAEGAIAVLKKGLEAPQTFVQADTLLMFELAWTLLAQRRHQEAAEAFVRLTEMNSWSHATYYFIAAGCYISLGNIAKAQELLDALPELLSKKKVGGKDLPTEVLIRKKLEFYKEKQKRRGGDPAKFAECISISPADELAIFWNTHQRIDDAVATAHIAELAALTPAVAIAVPSPLLPAIDEKHQVQPEKTPADLDTPDERALRALLLGIMHRTLRLYAPARALLEAARGAQGVKVSTWIAGVALFEMAVNDLKEADAGEKQSNGVIENQDGEGKEKTPLDKAGWAAVLAGVDKKLDEAQGFAGKSDIDLSSRLDSRIALLRDEIAAKRGMVGI